jgi:hypothetical protein
MIGFGIKKSVLNFVLARLSDLKDVFFKYHAVGNI